MLFRSIIALEVMSYEKAGFLLKLIVHEKPSSAIIFCETQERVNEVYDMLYKNGISVHKIHGGMLQTDRLENMDKKYKNVKKCNKILEITIHIDF